MKISDIKDPFVEARQQKGYAQVSDQDDPVTMMLRLKDVRKCAHNAKTFSSEDIPGRIVVPSEVNIRTTRQIPFEVDPPKHKGFRGLLDPWFKRPLEDDYKQKLHSIVDKLVTENLAGNSVEVIKEFSLVLQSRALTLLLNTPFEDSKLWISWGTHVFRSEGDALDGDKAQVLYDYLDEKLDEALANPSDDLFSVLLGAEVDGKKMSKEEAKGVLILTFAGGRDTVINAVSNTIAYLADHPESLQRLRDEPEIRGRAIEEFIRYFSPLTHMGRVVKEDTQVCEHAAKADTRISLCWASANRDETVFENPNEIVLDRKLNPHVGFGFSHHNCLGATHARQILSTLIDVFCEKVSTIDLLDAQDNIEHWDDFDRKVGYENLTVKFNKA
ncbi:cytochrome P450 [Paraglaciecola sp. L3A3]|uniref:cytochrome P450 n=1 Tax=Paraglaciecola sp. L3A3 TaxID=2686358 RepID=UPI00131D76E7|nr:cytochrome P450 [Paraglaciecola sp. L3A3]